MFTPVSDQLQLLAKITTVRPALGFQALVLRRVSTGVVLGIHRVRASVGHFARQSGRFRLVASANDNSQQEGKGFDSRAEGQAGCGNSGAGSGAPSCVFQRRLQRFGSVGSFGTKMFPQRDGFWLHLKQQQPAAMEAKAITLRVRPQHATANTGLGFGVGQVG